MIVGLLVSAGEARVRAVRPTPQRPTGSLISHRVPVVGVAEDAADPEPAGGIVDIVDEPRGAVQYLLLDGDDQAHDVFLRAGGRVSHNVALYRHLDRRGRAQPGAIPAAGSSSLQRVDQVVRQRQPRHAGDDDWAGGGCNRPKPRSRG